MDYDAMHVRAEELPARPHLTDMNVAAPVMNYGSGYQQLFEIVEALVKNARLLILDGPVSSPSTREIEVLLSIIDNLKCSGMACVHTSHKLDEIKRVCDTATVIRDGKHIGTRPAADVTIGNIITIMVGRGMTSLFPKVEHAVSDVVMEAHSITYWDVTSPNRKRTGSVSLVVCRDEILGVAGLVGVGHVEMVSVLFGVYPGRPNAEIIMDSKPVKATSPMDTITTGIHLVPEGRKRHGIVPLMAVGENITLVTLAQYARDLCVDRGAGLTTINREVRCPCIEAASPVLAIASLSGGNQQKTVITKMMLAMPKVLILDEPTHGIDVSSKYNIYKIIADLAAGGATIIMVSSEMPKILGASDRVLVIGEDRLRGNFVDQGFIQERVLVTTINAELDRQAA